MDKPLLKFTFTDEDLRAKYGKILEAYENDPRWAEASLRAEKAWMNWLLYGIQPSWHTPKVD